MGLGMLFSPIFTSFSGTAVRLIMKKIGIALAQSPGIILTKLTDIMRVFTFLGFAVLRISNIGL
jgi:Mg/Co/Ni transporter MgtE